MSIKGLFKDSSFIVQILILIAVSTIGIVFASLITNLFLVFKFGFSVEELTNASILFQDASLIRVMQFFQTLGIFFFPAIFLAIIYSNDKKSYLQTEKVISGKIFVLIILSILIIIPFMNLMMRFNSMMELPPFMNGIENWMLKMEQEGQQLTEKTLLTNSIWDLLFNILIIAVIASAGEELFFRGVVQNIFRKIFKNEHVIIWTVAIIFSAIHLQFYGFIPRMLLGAYLGYLLYYTKSMWAPILAHFANNLTGVLSYYFIHDPKKMTQLEELGTGSGWWLSILSLLLWGIIFYFIKLSSINKLANRT